MRTPQEWTKNLENGTISEEMLDAALYSVNKRAKNCRDQKSATHPFRGGIEYVLLIQSQAE